MTYVVSDLHGYPLERLKRILDEVGFIRGDRLFVLGDCIDRGSDGLALIRFIMTRPEITLLLGNHESMLLKNRELFEGERIPGICELYGERRKAYSVWVSNGGYATIDAMQQYTSAQTKYIFDYLERAPLYKEIEVEGKRYVLCHSGLGNFNKDKELCDYSEYDLLWNRPSLETRYFEDGRIVIFGHTPTTLYGSKFKNKPVFTDTWIDVDVGASLGLSPLLLRLDDMKEFYF